jgi:hypothetical protein
MSSVKVNAIKRGGLTGKWWEWVKTNDFVKVKSL